MIGKAKSNQSLNATISYNLKEGSSLIYQNKLHGLDISDHRLQIEDLQKCYQGRSRQLTIHAILSPGIEDGKKLSQENWNEIASKYLIKMNLIGHQAIGFLHKDREHRHLHLIINKVNDSTLKLYHDSYIGKKTQKVADQIAEEMNLVRARKIMFQRSLQAINEKDIGSPLQYAISVDKGIKLKMKLILEEEIQVKHKDAESFFNALEKKNLVIHRYKNNQTKELRGYGIELGGCVMDASAIGRKYTLRALGLQTSLINNNDTKTNCKSTTSQLVRLTNNKGKKILEELVSNYGINKESLKDDRILMLQRNNYYYLAIQNDRKGYTLYNTYTKTYEGEKDITTIFSDKEYQTIVVQDLFSYLRWKQENRKKRFNFLIINSPSNKEKLSEKIASLPLSKITIALINQPGSELVNKIILDYIKQLFIGDSHIPKRKKGFSTIDFTKRLSIPKSHIEVEEEQEPQLKQSKRIR
ncbi:MAG: relaxase/mobilization nuclease domain-containing protein [Chitinophagaceae bacterium]|jgi:hypothetical protein|nr:relaxase/mobilization nuclease domain-containing protein [Chitinophagaceae bacterium]MCA6455405.1 relaxase/mobilization nuclease domain-containing protein [Chitinophagaceae bacterium]MCA6459043.1 relaxase/mobilization nuclease domain-containing protein [Chitinophagaceae bacterium]MCA6465573.1 relaxase/mobilization nuclease domain-containing protein [Chitinophagaceae bacterium]